jgi:hypothetical protein
MVIVTLLFFSIITFTAKSTWSHSDVLVISVTTSVTVPDICLRSFSQVAQSSSFGIGSRMWSEHVRHVSLSDVNSKVRSGGSEQDWLQSCAYIFWLFLVVSNVRYTGGMLSSHRGAAYCGRPLSSALVWIKWTTRMTSSYVPACFGFRPTIPYCIGVTPCWLT